MSDILKPSYQSLYLETFFDWQKLGNATGFLVDSERGLLLIANRHVIKGLNNNTDIILDTNGRVPNEIVITHNKSGQIGTYLCKTEKLFTEDGKPKWIEHPILGSKADFIALPLTDLDGVEVFPYFLEEYLVDSDNRRMKVLPSDIINIVGFPFWIKSSDSFAIWSTGFLATDLRIEHDNLPIFLVDCRSRKWQSGSPVIAHRNAGISVSEEHKDNPNTSSSFTSSAATTRFLGIYSGRINEESDLWIVWKTSAIKELVDSIK